MTDIDLSRLPTGSMGWRALVGWAAESDDRIERFFLELKSDVDLTGKHGQHKVAKFVLGSAHRDPIRSGKRFGGHAIMLIGVSRNSIVGVPPFEAKDLAREVEKFTGVDGPVWDFELIPVDADHDVVAIVVDPPAGRIWPSLSDGEGLVNGDIYVRGDGETRKAKGAEVQLMLARSADVSTLPTVDVEVVGEAHVIQFDETALLTWIEEQTAELRDQGRPRPKSSGLEILSAVSMDRRSRAEFLQEVEAWHASATADPPAGLRDLVAGMTASARIRVNNQTKQFMRDVRVDIEFDDGVEALASLDPEDARPFPDMPKDFGRDSIHTLLTGADWNRGLSLSDDDREVVIRQHSPARLALTMKVLRPMEDFKSEQDEFVIAQFVTVASEPTVTGRWRLTAGDINDVRSGEFTMPTSFRDWIEPIDTLLHGET